MTMKNDKTLSNTKLGILVIAGSLFLVFSLYMIGKNQNIFGSSILVSAQIDHVNGLVPGNNVRFQGLEVGTVKSLQMENDSTIVLSMLIQKSMQSFIKKNSKITINTDGLMGNKIVQVHPQPGESSPIEEGDVLFALKQVGTEEMLEKLSSTGEYLEQTLINLAEITQRLNESEAIWQILADPELAQDLIHEGITLVGGGAMLRGLDQRLADATDIPVRLVEAPLECVVLGAGHCIESYDVLKTMFMDARG